MENRRAFGRRFRQMERPVPASAKSPIATTLSMASPEPSLLEQEIQDWKPKRPFRFPWRPFSLMAGLSFGAASFVLPAAMNQKLQWPPYASGAIAFYGALRRKQRKISP